jgi:aminopeptidase N
MKQRLLLIFFFLPLIVLAQSNIDVLHYKYEIELNDNNDTITGRAEIAAKVVKDADAFTFDIAFAEKSGKGMSIESTYLYVDEQKKWNKIGFVQNTNNSCTIRFDKNITRETIFKIAVVYKGIPADGLIISKNKYGSRTFFGDNWPNRAHHWLPCVDNPGDKASVEFIITAPNHYQVVANGILIEETNLPNNKKLTHWKEEVPLPTKVMVIGVADFAVNNIGDVNCIPVSSWVFPENKEKGFYDYAIAKEILAYYINYIGPYAYKKLANVQSKTMFGGMENASAIFYFENSVTGSRLEEPLIAHEIVHQWFGNTATEKSFEHLWLSEGFATYLSHLYLESKYGTDTLRTLLHQDREQVLAFVKNSKRPVVDNTNDYMSLLNANSYQKGGWVLHMLRRELGDSIFKRAIRKYYETYAGKNAETKDLQRVFETVSGKNLELFFKQWLFTGENPDLLLKWNYDTRKKAVLVVLTQQQKTEFKFPLTVELRSKTGKKIIQQLTIDSKTKSFSIPFSEKPMAVVADPQTSLLSEITVTN